ncbi:MAG: asparagine synthase-related protein [Verrucomicrobiia bacterium]
MPGITGIIGANPRGENQSALEAMVRCMKHEPFYTLGTIAEARLGAWVGWAVHQNSFSDCLPVWNETKDVGLIFTGEEFSDESEIEALRARGHGFAADDASWLVHAYEEHGAAFVEKLNGCFSGVILDLRQDKVVLFNDRYGLSRIYLHENENGVYFSSEAKSLLRVLPGLRRIDPVGLAEYSSCGCVLQNRTLFAGISLLPPASRLIFSQGRLERKETYFHMESWENLPRLGEAEYYERLKTSFARVVPKYFRGRARVGVSLTGGLDGRMIMACGGHAPGSMPCYTFGGPYRDCNDVTLARAVAQRCGQPHQVIPVDGTFFGQFAALAERSVYVSDGAMDVTGSVELFANRLAREIAPVRMTGNYGSEILRSNVAFKAQPLSPELFAPEFLKRGDAAAATYAEEARGNRLSLIAFKQVPWHHHSRLSVEQSLVTMRSPYLDNELVALAYQTPAGQEAGKTPALRFIAESNDLLGRIPTDRGLVYRPTPVLTKLRHFYQEFAFKADYAYDYGMPQWLAKIDHVFASLHLEKIFLGRHKFYHFRVWYRDRLGAYLKEVLLDPRTKSRSHVQGARLEALVNEHISGRRNHTTELHQALSIELIYRQLIERND